MGAPPYRLYSKRESLDSHGGRKFGGPNAGESMNPTDSDETRHKPGESVPTYISNAFSALVDESENNDMIEAEMQTETAKNGDGGDVAQCEDALNVARKHLVPKEDRKVVGDAGEFPEERKKAQR